MTWKEFKDEVKALLTTDADRIGIEANIDRLTRAAVADLQTYIPKFQANHIDIFSDSQLVLEEKSSAGSLQTGAKPREWFIVDSSAHDDPKSANRLPLTWIDWRWRHHLSREGMAKFGARYAVGPDGVNFYVTPAIDANHDLIVHWDGVKRKFQDKEELPLPDNATQAVYYFVKGHILTDYDKSSDGLIWFNNSTNRPGHYQVARRTLYLESVR